MSMPSNWSANEIGKDRIEKFLAEWIGRATDRQYPLGIGEPETWLVVGGRGAGKTMLGAEWVTGLVRGFEPFVRDRLTYGAIALVGETLADAREVMVEGPAGLLALRRDFRPRFEPSRRRLTWPNGAVAQLFSSEDPESLRGPQFDAAWCDELAKWKHPDATWDMLQFGLRLGRKPRRLVTTTARPLPLLKRLMTEPGVTLTTMRSEENAANLAPGFLAAMRRRYGGTRLGRQELDGELVEGREDALWSRDLLEGSHAGGAGEPKALERIVVALDPPATSRRTSDACGIVVAGRTGDGRAVVLRDATMKRAGPTQWARRAVALYREFEADAIVAEVNQGGDMVATVLRTVDPLVVVREVRASRGKWLRAEPVAALYEQRRVVHARRFPELEDEMCNFGLDGLADGRSPDRLDALVWAVTDLLLGPAHEPRIRALG